MGKLIELAERAERAGKLLNGRASARNIAAILRSAGITCHFEGRMSHMQLVVDDVGRFFINPDGLVSANALSSSLRARDGGEGL